tara:strand:- start:770 stop:1252 length:483 start_codon:yes stop_codon:yes gene_type:complete
MANVVPYAFKQGILKGFHDFTTAGTGTGTYYLALFTDGGGPTPPYAVGDTSYTSATANQVGTVGTGYTTNGNALNTGTVGQQGNYSYVDWANTTWGSSTITARYGVIYKRVDPGGTTADQYLVAILDFGADITSTAGDFTVSFPPVVTGLDAVLSITGNP